MGMLCYCISVQLPNLSLFPEITFASKVPDPAFSELLHSLSNAETSVIVHRLRGDMYIGVDHYDGQVGQVSVSTSELPYQLQMGAAYM